MEKDKKIKIYLGLAYFLIVILFLWAIFNKFSYDELTSYDFIKNNRDYLISLKESNFFLISLIFLIFTILWVLLLGFGSPIFLLVYVCNGPLRRAWYCSELVEELRRASIGAWAKFVDAALERLCVATKQRLALLPQPDPHLLNRIGLHEKR